MHHASKLLSVCVCVAILFVVLCQTVIFIIITMQTTKSKIIANNHWFWYTCITCTMLTDFDIILKVQRIYIISYSLLDCAFQNQFSYLYIQFFLGFIFWVQFRLFLMTRMTQLHRIIVTCVMFPYNVIHVWHIQHNTIPILSLISNIQCLWTCSCNFSCLKSNIFIKGQYLIIGRKIWPREMNIIILL